MEAKRRPDTVETFDAPLLEEGAAPAAFRWRGRVHRIVRVEGPERIAPEWWRRPGGATRDYYRVEDGDGRRFWLFRAIPPRTHPSAACSAPPGAGMITLTRKGSERDGMPDPGSGIPDSTSDLPAPSREAQGEGASAEKWYLHGLFA